MEGRVIKSTGSWYEVLGDDEKKYNCRLQGKLRLEDNRESNPVALGDRVRLIVEGNDASIGEILPRKNHILRQSVKKTGHLQVLAANVDQVIVMASLHQPRTSLGFIDRFLVSAESFRIPQVLLFNKRDLLSAAEMEEVEKILQVYTSIGVKSLLISAQEGEGIEHIGELIKNKTSLVAGHSGVGKSTMLNLLSPLITQQVKEISGFSQKGTHTTTFAEMFILGDNTFIIDTPGIKEWGLAEMGQQEISDYFPEMRELRLGCKFGSRCLHLTEPNCAIRQAVEQEKIAISRYDSYVSMVMGEDNRK